MVAAYDIGPHSLLSMSDFGEWLSRMRQGRHLSRRALGRAIGRSDVMVGYLEEGERNPSRDMVERLVAVLAPEDADEVTRARIFTEAMKAAGFHPAQEIERIAEPLETRVDAFLGNIDVDEEMVRPLRDMILAAARKGHKERSDIIGKRSDAQENAAKPGDE